MNRLESEQAVTNPSATNPLAGEASIQRQATTQGSWPNAREFFVRSRERSRILWQTGVVQLVLLALELPGLFLDHRTVSGINPWIKPIKFDISIAVYSWTMAWILAQLAIPFARRIANRIALCMLAEIAVITIQAVRGVKSHFNTSTPFDFAMFGVMGLFIVYNTYLMVRVTVEYFTAELLSLPQVLQRGIQLGLIFGLLGSMAGAVMVGHGAHAVGVSDGGTGLPFLNWSTRGGDLRITHFLGLHGLQFMLIAGYLLSAPKLPLSTQTRTRILYACFVCCMIMTAFAFVWACLGQPSYPVNSR
jgi:hypothetical protein